LALEILANLPYVESLPAKPLWPLMLKKRKVCAATGLPKAKQCTQTVMDHFIPGVSHTALCQGQCRDKKTSTPKATKATRIVRPINGQTFALLPSQNNPTLPLEADSASEVFWFVNGIFFAKATPNKVLQLPLHPGTFDITCTTESGQADRARIFVE
jgi:membrane carboxypeptidase/penicillin-binding protein PbpC